MKFKTGLALLALGLSAHPSLADEEQDFDEALRNFGFTAGSAWQCSQDVTRDEVDGQVLRAFNGIAQLFGTDRAFGFAAGFGAGAATETPETDCAAQIAAFQDGIASAGMTGAETVE